MKSREKTGYARRNSGTIHSHEEFRSHSAMTSAGPDSSYWDEIGQHWPSVQRPELWRLHSDAVNRGLLQDWWPKRAVDSVLKTDLFDEVVGEGLMPFLDRRSKDCHGLDISPKIAQLARQRYAGVMCTAGDVRELPFASNCFDLVVSNSTLDHFHSSAEIDRSLLELFRIMAPGATLVITMDNPVNPVLALRARLPDSWLRAMSASPYFIGVTLGKGALCRALQQAGFVVRDTRFISHYPRVLATHGRHGKNGRDNMESSRKRVEKMSRWEKMAHWPSARFSGYFVAARAIKPE